MMKRLLIIFLVLLTVTAADAQRKKSRARKKARHSVRHTVRQEADPDPEPEQEFPYVSVGADKKMVLTDPPEGQPQPYVLINDVPYYGKLQDLKVDDVLEVSVIRRKGARMIYGQKAAAGAVIIKAKRLPDGMAALAPAQLKPVTRKSFIFNEEVTFGNVSDIDPNKILSIDTLVQPKFVGSAQNDTTVNITTKVYGKKLYQWKFGTFSKAYKSYIRSRRGKDDGVNYVLSDGTILIGGKEEDLIRLLKVYNSDIASATFTPAHGNGDNRVPATLNIEIKQATISDVK